MKESEALRRAFISCQNGKTGKIMALSHQWVFKGNQEDAVREEQLLSATRVDAET
jgi:hypothetical protein